MLSGQTPRLSAIGGDRRWCLGTCHLLKAEQSQTLPLLCYIHLLNTWPWSCTSYILLVFSSVGSQEIIIKHLWGHFEPHDTGMSPVGNGKMWKWWWGGGTPGTSLLKFFWKQPQTCWNGTDQLMCCKSVLKLGGFQYMCCKVLRLKVVLLPLSFFPPPWK